MWRSSSLIRLDSEHNVATQLLKQAVAGSASRLSAGSLEIPALELVSCTFATIEVCLVSPAASAVIVSRVPHHVYFDRTIDIELANVSCFTGTGAALETSLARWLSANSRLAIVIEVPGKPQREVPVLVKARSFDGGLIARALARPASWADAASVTVVSLSLAGRPLPCDCLPATLRVGYNHSPAPEGAVLLAAEAGDVAALQAALDAGGSTEETDEVRITVL